MLPNRISQFPGRGKRNALLDNITTCGRVVGVLRHYYYVE